MCLNTFKVGDLVKVRNFLNDLDIYDYLDGIYATPQMKYMVGKIFKVTDFLGDNKVVLEGTSFLFHKRMLESFVPPCFKFEAGETVEYNDPKKGWRKTKIFTRNFHLGWEENVYILIDVGYAAFIPEKSLRKVCEESNYKFNVGDKVRIKDRIKGCDTTYIISSRYMSVNLNKRYILDNDAIYLEDSIELYEEEKKQDCPILIQDLLKKKILTTTNKLVKEVKTGEVVFEDGGFWLKTTLRTNDYCIYKNNVGSFYTFSSVTNGTSNSMCEDKIVKVVTFKE